MNLGKGESMSDFESPLKFPNPEDGRYWDYLHGKKEKMDLEGFKEDYESCLVELGLIIERTFDPVLRGKLEALMRDVPEWLT